MNSIRSFLAGIVDYAGLFPPAGLDMETAARNYAQYRAGDDRDLLGRFVVPAARLDEFSEAARQVLEKGEAGEPWRLSVLIGDDLAAASKAVLEFNCRHGSGPEQGRAVCDAVEIHARKEGDVTAAANVFPELFRIFFEIPLDPDPRPMLQAISRHPASAKMRTGGVTEAAFPTSASIVRFVGRSNELGVPFKATAGLHHALRSSYPLTYEADSRRGMMFGYLNLFLAAAFIRRGMSEHEAREVLEERSVGAFTFSGGGVLWRGHELSASDLAAARSRLALSFGSCSFREPVDEARALHLI
jgi:hypothetical protein